MQKGGGGDAVSHNVKIIRALRVIQRFRRKEDIGGAVFDQQDLKRPQERTFMDA